MAFIASFATARPCIREGTARALMPGRLLPDVEQTIELVTNSVRACHFGEPLAPRGRDIDKEMAPYTSTI